MTNADYPQQPFQPPQPPKKRRIWPWVLGVVLIVIIGGFAACSALVIGGANEVGKAINSASAEADKPIELTLKVTGTGPAMITYDNNGQQTQETEADLPWEKKTTVKGYLRIASLNATNGVNSSGKITCQVLRDGKVIIENTASGPGASASCTGDIDGK